LLGSFTLIAGCTKEEKAETPPPAPPAAAPPAAAAPTNTSDTKPKLELKGNDPVVNSQLQKEFQDAK